MSARAYCSIWGLSGRTRQSANWKRLSVCSRQGHVRQSAGAHHLAVQVAAMLHMLAGIFHVTGVAAGDAEAALLPEIQSSSTACTIIMLC